MRAGGALAACKLNWMGMLATAIERWDFQVKRLTGGMTEDRHLVMPCLTAHGQAAIKNTAGNRAGSAPTGRGA